MYAFGASISTRSPCGSKRAPGAGAPTSDGAHLAKVNKVELADLLGYTERTLTDWQAEGLPIEQAGARGQENVYDTAACVAWLLERTARKIRGESPRDEYLRSQTRLNDIKLAELEGRLVDVDEVEARFGLMIVGARQRLLQIPATIHDALEGLGGKESKRALLEAAIREALTALAAYDPEREPAAQTSGHAAQGGQRAAVDGIAPE